MSNELSTALETHRVTNLWDLIKALDSLRSTTLGEGADWEEVYVNGEKAAGISLALVERTLTDGSVVYDVEVG